MPRRPILLLWAVAVVLVLVAPPRVDAATHTVDHAASHQRAVAGPEQCVHQTVADSSKAAMAVFSGTVTSVTRLNKTNGQRGANYIQQVTVSLVYGKGVTSEHVQVQTDRTPGECSLGPLVQGQSYLFFVSGAGDPWVATGDGGTAPSTDQLVSQVVRLRGQGEPPVPPEPEHARFTPLHPHAPASLSRLAAPGLALVLVGLLGLLLVRGLARRVR